MQKILYLIAIFAILLTSASIALAKQEGNGEQPEITNPELKTENQGTGQALQATLTQQNNEGEGETANNKEGVGNNGNKQQGVHEAGTGIANPELKAGNNNEEKAKKEEKQGPSEVSLQRRSQVANAVQEMLKVANRNRGIGEQVREIAQNRNQVQEQVEADVEKIQSRKKFTKFFFGPNYKKIKSAEEKLAQHTEKIEELKTLKEKVNYSADKKVLEDQIKIMEQVTEEIKNQLGEEQKGFALFGWLNKFINR